MRPWGRYSRQAFGAKASLPTPSPLVAAKMVSRRSPKGSGGSSRAAFVSFGGCVRAHLGVAA